MFDAQVIDFWEQNFRKFYLFRNIYIFININVEYNINDIDANSFQNDRI